MPALRHRIAFPPVGARLVATVLSAAIALLWQAQAWPQAPMQAQAQRAAQGPMKLDVRPLVHVAHAGDKVSVEVRMLDANNQPAAWNRQCQVDVNVRGPSGKAQEYGVTLPSGQSVARLTIDAPEVGLLRISAREKNATLLPAGNSLLVNNRPAPAKKKRRVKRSALPLTPAAGSVRILTVAARVSGPGELLAMLTPGRPGLSGAPQTPPPSAPELLLTNSTGKDEVLADGKDAARIQVYYMDPQGAAAASDIQIWLTWSNGKLDPQPLVIKKDGAFAEAEWTSFSPVNATVSLVTSAPKLAVNGPRGLQVSFVPPIRGIGAACPNPLKLSLIDSEPVLAQFFDPDGRAIQTSKPRQITFTSSNPSLHVEPASFDVPTNGSGATIFLLPTWSGKSKLDIWTPGYDHQTLEVEVTMWFVLVLCLAGGIIGGIAARDALKGTVAWRVFVGIVGGIVLVWLCVFAVLPQTHSLIAHNLVSVFVVAVVGGFGGTRVLDFAGKKLGYL